MVAEEGSSIGDSQSVEENAEVGGGGAHGIPEGAGAHGLKEDAPVEPSLDEKSLGDQETYKVNPTFRSFGEEKKFDDWVMPFIKDADTEQKVRDLFQAKYSIERVKQKRDEYQQQLEDINPKYMELDRLVSSAVTHLQNKDMASFQREVGIPDELILLRAKQIFDQQSNPALRQQEDEQYANNQRIRDLEAQNANLNQTAMNVFVQQREFELKQRLAQSDVADIIKAFDQRAGKTGAFRDEVVKRGQYYYHTSGEDKSVDELVSELIPLVGIHPPATAPVSMQPSLELGKASVSREQKPTIPSVSGRGTSPAKKTIKSLDDLRAISASLASR